MLIAANIGLVMNGDDSRSPSEAAVAPIKT